MKWSWFGRATMALLSALALGLSMTACGGTTIAYIWTLGGQYNQIVGFKVDNHTGNLTAIEHSPFSTNGANPVYLLVKPGGRYVYIVNQGSGSTATANSNDSGIAVFAVGGDGSLTFQQTYQTQGFKHIWAAFDGTGNNLFVLDQYSPSGDGNGAITTFAADANTGRLTLVAETAAAPSGAPPLYYLEVGADPIMMASTQNCLFTLNGSNQTVTPYTTTNGQLGIPTTGVIPVTTSHATSLVVNTGGTLAAVTDAGISTTSNGNTTQPAGIIVPYTVTTGCNLTSFTGGVVTNPNNIPNPVYSFFDASSAYLFVLNQNNTNSTAAGTANSDITAFNIVSGQLREVPGGIFPTETGPVCMVEDPTHNCIYTSNAGGFITGYRFTNTEGTLENLPRGSSFNTNNTGTGCLSLSGSVD